QHENELDELPDSTTVFWRVKASNEYGQTTWADDDTTGWSFRVMLPTPPAEFPMWEPADGDTVRGDSVTLQWSGTGDADAGDSVRYEIQWTADPTFSLFLSDTTADTTYTITDFSVIPSGMGTFGEDFLEAADDTVLVYWRVRAFDRFGLGTWANDDSTGWSFLFIETGNEPPTPVPPGIPVEYTLWGVYPNPFNPELNLDLNVVVGLPHRAHIRIRVYNVLGRLVAELADNDFPQGYRAFNFRGQGLASGLYFIHVEVPNRINTVKKVVLLR
ncbi:MAG TPA: T9SS type A sorting domain-containing protein, partial [Bacteroidetes bacterium]|nr:T9SS type A sorting domain-containing protein [Bacteroidota bacterium]